jgi:hypothetical protein
MHMESPIISEHDEEMGKSVRMEVGAVQRSLARFSNRETTNMVVGVAPF